MGKHQGEQEHTQAQILELIRSHALGGKTVGRLKGGDPLVFGRGAEEWAFALELGIRVELIPGVSSAIALPGLAGIPLSYRRMSQAFAVITGHCKHGDEYDWDRYARIDTLVILMGVQNRVSIATALIEAGRSPSEPVAFIERGSLAEEAIVLSELGKVASGHVQVRSPAVFVIGQVVQLRDRLTTSAVRQELNPDSES